jgi:hypothetical protein
MIGAFLLGGAAAACTGELDATARRPPAAGEPQGEAPDLSPEFGPGGSCDMQAIMAKPENGCVNAQCHGPLFQGGLDLASPGVEARLVGVASSTDACGGQALVDVADPENSLLLRAVDHERFALAPCGVLMPWGSETGVAADDLRCFEKWVHSMAASAMPADDLPRADFEPVGAASYVNKIKTLLTGLPPTRAEVDSVSADPAALRGLVAAWVESPEFGEKLHEFLGTALQQRISGSGTLNTQFLLLRGENTRLSAFRSNLEESFVRTAVDIVESGRPFTEIITTRRWALTTAALSALTFLDNETRALRAEKHRIFRDPEPGLPTPLSLRYSAENRIWHLPSLPEACTVSEIDADRLLEFMIGFVQCPGGVPQYRFRETVLTDADFQDWRFVELATASSDAEVLSFYELDELRGATRLALQQPRAGFFTTPAFLANWETNEDNQFRVTIGQSLIVALGEIFSPADATKPARVDAVDAAHAEPSSTCYGCHQFLDPMREYFAQSYAFNYQLSEKPSTLIPSFAFKGYVRDGGTLFDFSAALAAHPNFPTGWTQKLCYWANSQPCAENDQEFQRVAEVFAQSGYNFKTLVVELMASPLVTGSRFVETYRTVDPVVSITRKQHLCQLLDARLGIDDACSVAASFAGLVPEDEFSRGTAEPVQTSVTGLFHFAAAEKLCSRLATKLIANNDQALFHPSQPELALDELVDNLMGLGSGHARRDSVRAELANHLAAAKAESDALNALRSAFVVACVSPDVMAMGL